MDLLDIVVKLRLDKSDFVSELQEAENEAKETGEAVERAGENGGKGMVSGLTSKFSEFGGKMTALGGKMVDFGAKVSLIGNNLTSNITKPALNAAGALAKIVLGKGWERMNTLTEAKNKLKVLGVEGEHLNKTMGIIGDTVDGTAFSTAQFANTAAQAVSMGYDENSGLAGYLQAVSNLAAFTGRDVEQISSIQAKIASQNKLTGETFQQLSDAAVPVLQWIQEEYGVTAEEARKMVADGDISFADYENLVSKHLDGMAKAVGDSTLQGALSSTEAYIAKLGEAFLGSEDNAKSFAGQLLPLVNSFNEWLVSLSGKATEVGAVVGETLGAVIQYVKTGKVDTDSLSGSAQTLFGVIQPIIDAVQKVVDVGKKLFEILGPEKVGMIIAAVLGAGPIISLIGGIVGGIGTLISVVGTLVSGIGTAISIGSAVLPVIGGILTAIGPVGVAFLAISAVVIAVAVAVYKNWDKIKAKTEAVWNAVKSKVSGAVSGIKSAISGIQGAVATVRNTFDRIKQAISSKIDAAKDKVRSVISKIKGYFPFSVGKVFSGWIPKIKLWTSKNKDNASTNSSTSRTPFAKAMAQPYMFKRPTEFYAGEAGDEMLYGKQSLMNDIKEATANIDTGQNVVIYNTITVEGAESPEDFAERFVRKMKLDMRAI